MKHTYGFLFELPLLLLASTALAQTDIPQATTDLNASEHVAFARCAYTPTDNNCADEISPTNGHGSNSTTTLAQTPHRMPGPIPGPMGGPPMVRPGMWMSRPSTAHVLIGGLIGFGFGVAAGARGSAGVRGSIGIGALFGFIGAGIGAGIPSLPSPRYYRRDWPDDEEASRSKPASSRPNPARQTAARQPDHPPQTTTADQNPHPVAAEAP